MPTLVGTTIPYVVFPLGLPFTSQATVPPFARQNEALNDCVLESATLAAVGEMALIAAQVIVILALAVFELSATLVAVTVTLSGDGTLLGAV